MLKEQPKDPTLPISPRKKNQTRKTSIEKEKAYSLSEESIKSNSTQHFHSTQNPLWLCQKKKKSITFTVPNTPICPEKKEKKNYQRKVKQLNKTQMRKLKKVHIFKNPR